MYLRWFASFWILKIINLGISGHKNINKKQFGKYYTYIIF